MTHNPLPVHAEGCRQHRRLFAQKPLFLNVTEAYPPVTDGRTHIVTIQLKYPILETFWKQISVRILRQDGD